MIDRSSINQCLAKAIAYHQCGKQVEAECWAFMLIQSLECTGILNRGSNAAIMLRERSMNDIDPAK
jgi:hypothetical protein